MSEISENSTGTRPDVAIDDHHNPANAARNNRVIWLLVIATFVVILNETIMSVAIRNISDTLHITELLAQWVSTAFMLTMAVIIPITGWLLQRIPTRQVFILAMSLFAAGTVVAGIAPNFALLLVGRIVQASGTAVMMPLLMTTLMMLVAPERRGQMMARVSMTISVAPALGPTIGGFILSHFGHWRALFIFMAPIAIIMLIIGARLVENVTEGKKSAVDLVSIPLAALGFGGLVFGLTGFAENAGNLGSSSALTHLWLPLGVGVLALFGFIQRQLQLQKSDRALLDLRTFGSRNFVTASLLMMVNMVVLFGCIILLQLYLQNGLGFDTTKAGLVVLPGGLAMGLLAPTVGKLYDRHGPQPLMVPGSIVVSACLWIFTTFNADTGWLLIVLVYIALSIGLALLFTPLFTAGLGSIEPRYYSHGSAIFGTVQQLSGGIGTALFVTIMTGVSVASIKTGSQVNLALIDGVRAAFIVGASLSLISIALAFMVKKPEGIAPGHGGSH